MSAIEQYQSVIKGAGTNGTLTAERQIAPYSDLLLHDMGAGLSDHQADTKPPAANGARHRYGASVWCR
jgi:CxxC motif-containing protein (DUF1111 family)